MATIIPDHHHRGATVTQSGRIKRPVPKRIDPDRSWKSVLGGVEPGTPSSNGGPSQGSAPRTVDGREPSYDAVNDAYRVIDDYLRQGQRVAERIWMPAAAENGS